MSTSPFFFKAFLGNNGRPAASGWFFAYAAGSTVPKPIYSDRNNTIPLANPLRLDGNGVCPQFFTEAGLYDFKVYEYNFVTPSAPGPSCFTAEDIDGETGSGGGPAYVLPIATETVLGGVKPDGTTVQVDGVTGVLSVIPEEQTPELAGYAEGGYTEFIWRNETANVLGRSAIIKGNNLFRMSDFALGMTLVTRWFGFVADAATISDLTRFICKLGGQSAGQIERPGTGTEHQINYEVVTRYAMQNRIGDNIYLMAETALLWSDNYGDTSPATTTHLRHLDFDPIDVNATVSLELEIYNTSPNFKNGYRQSSFQAWMENAQRSSTPDPALLFQPLEDQRLSTGNAVAFSEVMTDRLRANSTTRSGSSALPSTTIVTEHSGAGMDTEALPLATGSHDLRIYQNDGTKAWTVACSGADTMRVPDPLATATSTIVYPGNSRWIYDSAPGVWKVISPGPFLPLFAGELNPVTGQCWFGSPTSSGGIVVRTNTSGTGTTNIDYYGGTDGKRRLTLRWSDLANAYTIQTSNDDGSARLDRVKVPRDSARNLIFAGGVGHNVTTRTTTSATSTLAGITRYTGTGGHTEPLPAATVVGEVREYRNSGTGAWTLVRDGSDRIDPGNPSALVTSLTLLPGQSVRMYVAAANLWEVL